MLHLPSMKNTSTLTLKHFHFVIASYVSLLRLPKIHVYLDVITQFLLPLDCLVAGELRLICSSGNPLLELSQIPHIFFRESKRHHSDDDSF